MASFVIESAAKWVGKLLVEEVEFLAKVRDKVEGLQRELEWMKSFLLDADRKQYKKAIIRQWISEIRDLAQEAEDVIELYILEVSHKREKPLGLIPWTDLKWLLCCMRDAKTLHSVGSDIDSLINKINELTGRSQRYGIARSNDELIDPYLVFEKRFIDQRRTYSHTEDVVIGLDEHVKEVAYQLVNGPQKVAVIHGMGGIGKTTLARKVYNHASLKSQFEGFAWAYVSQQLQLGSVCREILLQLIPGKDKEERKIVKELQDSQLPSKLYDVLKSIKCLVVLDDIWFTEDWNCLKHAFPLNDNSCDSKVLVTTRNSQIFSCYPSHVVYYYEAKLLNPYQSWELLEKKADFKKDNAEAQMVEVGEKMLNHCSGHPLAIVVLGGILATKRTVEEWQDVCDNLQGDGLYSGVYEVLALSYYELSYHLKACFLVLGYFPEDFEIPAERLYHLWIAEGIASPRQDREGGKRSLEDIAKVYLNELVHKGMVQVVSRNMMGDIKMCRIHDLMRDKCLQIAKDENFLLTSVYTKSHGLQQQHPSSHTLDDRIRRLAVYEGDRVPELEYLANSAKLPDLKSLLLFPSDQLSDYQSIGGIPHSLELLRILDFTGIPYRSLPRSIGTLIYLRYLSLMGTAITELPSEIGNLRSLLILDLRCYHLNLGLPNVLWKIKSLRQLCLPTKTFRYVIEDSKALRLDNLTHLEIIEGLNLDTTDVKGLQELSTSLSLQRLKATCFREEQNLDPLLKSSSIKSMSLDMDGSMLSSNPKMLSDCHHLHRLWIIHGNFGDIPTFPLNLVKLQFMGCQFSKEFVSTLEKLPQLKRLSLNLCFGWHLHVSSNGFSKLTHLTIFNNPWSGEWTVESGGLPQLQKLQIEFHEGIRKIPDTLPPTVSIICKPCVLGIEKYGSCPHYIRRIVDDD